MNRFRDKEVVYSVQLCYVIGEVNGCLFFFVWFLVIKFVLRYFKRFVYVFSFYVFSVLKKIDEYFVRYKMLDQRIKMKKIQNILRIWNRKQVKGK